MPKSTVYFIKDITPENVVKIYEKLGKELTGKVAVKVHSGEKGNQNYLHPEFMRSIVEHVHGTIVDAIPPTRVLATPPRSINSSSKIMAGPITSLSILWTPKPT